MNRYIITLFFALLLGAPLFATTPQGSLKEQERRLQALNQREDLIEEELVLLKERIADGDETAQSTYLNLEMELLALRAEVNSVKNNILRLTWEDPSQSDSAPQPQEENKQKQPLSRAKAFSKDARYISSLSAEDMERFKRAEQSEVALPRYINSYITNIYKLETLRNNYNKAKDEQSANEYLNSYNELLGKNRSTAAILIKTWSEIYDAKHFTHSYLLELFASPSALDKVTELRDARNSKAADWGNYPEHELLKRYVTEKEEILRLELLTSEHLNIPSIGDSVKVIIPTFERMVPIYPNIDLTPRIFVDYERETFLKSHYYSASNPIPRTKIHKNGVVYRIFVGNFDKKQPVTMFRQTKPVSYHIENKGYSYYVGGYQSFEDAQRAQAALRKQGFRKPQIVVWSDGVSRNLDKNPYAQTDSFRVEVRGVEELIPAAQQLLEELASSGVNVLKAGADLYIISPLSGEANAEELRSKIKNLERSASVEVKQNQ